MDYGVALSAYDQEKIRYVDSGCSKHMTWDKSKFLSLKENNRGNNITFENNLHDI